MGKQAKLKILKRQAKKRALLEAKLSLQAEKNEQQLADEQAFTLEEAVKEPLEENSQESSEQEHFLREDSKGVQRELSSSVAKTRVHGNLDKMEGFFRQILKQYTRPRDRAGILRNICAILEKKGLYLQALEISTQILQLVPDNTSYQAKYEYLKTLAEQCVHPLDRDAEEKRILAVIQVAETAKRKETEIAAHFSTPEQNNESLLPLSLQRTQDGLLKRTQFSSSVSMKIVSPDIQGSLKPLFNSQQEYCVYKILLELFPNYLVYPNMPLLNLFSFEQMREILDENDFDYFLKAHVDFCITKVSDYYPLVAFEVDSEYHDKEERIKKDEMKNRICCSGGLELVRLRPYGQLTEKEMRQEIGNHIQKWHLA